MKIEGQLLTAGSGETVLDDVHVLLVDGELESIDAMLPLLQKVPTTGRSLLIVANDIDDAVVAELEQLDAKCSPTCRAIKTPGFGDARKDVLGDIAALTGTQVVSAAIDDLTVRQLGRAGRIDVGAGATTIADGKGPKEGIRARVDELRLAINETTSDYHREKCEARLAHLLGGISGGEEALPETKQRLTEKPSIMEPWWAARRLGRNMALPLVGIALVLLGAGLFFVGENVRTKAIQTSNWPSVPGEVISSKVVKEQVRNVTDDSFSWRTTAQVEYSYTVKGKPYENGRIRYGEGTGGIGFMGRDDAEEMVDLYPMGKKVDVYYAPGNPADSILEPGTTFLKQQWSRAILAFLIVMGSLFVLTFAVGRIVTLVRRS